MDLNNVCIVDIETDGLLDKLTKLHVLSVSYKDKNGNWNIISTNSEERIQKLVGNPDKIIVGHNFIPYDKPALEKLGYTVNATIIDTLALSWYLYGELPKHGLEYWGEILGVKKPEIDDWENLSYEQYKTRCEEDVKINTNLWIKCLNLLRELYDSDEKAIEKVIKFANFKMENIKVQEENKILINIPKCKENLAYLSGIIEEKKLELKKILPPIPKKVKRTKPKTLYKKPLKKPKKVFNKDGTTSPAGQKWLDTLISNDLPLDYEGDIEVLSSAGQKWLDLINKLGSGVDRNGITELTEVVGYIEPNPTSPKQIKDFLFSLGWVPKIFKDGANDKVPQLRDDDKNLCTSVIKLSKKFPELSSLDGLSVAQHRAGYLKAFLDTSDDNGYVTASFNGFAKTWRFKHTKPIVNLPSNSSQYGELVRSVMIAPEGMLWANTDMSGLEDRCKQNCIYPYDPDYVDTMNIPGYDPHLAIGVRAEFMSEQEVNFFKWYKNKDKSTVPCPEDYNDLSDTEKSELFYKLGDIRSSAKTANYSLTYSCGVKKLAESADISLKKAKILHKTYWDQNWAVKKFAEDQIVKEVGGKDWIYNPYTNIWLHLTSDHIRFSAINQNFGSKVFDTFLFFLMEKGVKPICTMHDELSWYIEEGQEEFNKLLVQECIDKVNNCYKLPIKFESVPEFAKSYGDVH